MSTAPTFADWLADRLGTRQWVVSLRLTDRLRDRGYDVALTPKRWAALETEYNALLTAAKVERIALALFPVNLADIAPEARQNPDTLRAAMIAAHMALDPSAWSNRVHAVRAALAAENLI